MFSIQILFAFAVVVCVAVAWTTALTVAGTIWQRNQARTAKALHSVAILSQDATQTDDTRERVLR